MTAVAIGRKPLTNQLVTSVLSGALRSALAQSIAAAKELSNRVGCNVEAARNWIEGRNAPRATELIELIAEFDEVYEEVMRLAGRKPDGLPQDRNAAARAMVAQLQRLLAEGVL